MKTTDTNKEEKYVSPEMEILEIEVRSRFLQGSNTETPSGGDDPDIPWPSNP